MMPLARQAHVRDGLVGTQAQVVAVPAAIDCNLVPANEDLPQPSRVALDLLPDNEERGLRSVLFQQPEERLQPEIRPLIESERHRVFGAGSPNLGEEEVSVR